MSKRINSFEGIPNNQTALELLVAQLSGGTKYKVGNSTDANYGLVGLSVTHTSDLTCYSATQPQSNSFALVTFNNVANPDTATQILFPVVSLAALPAIYAAIWTVINVGSWPLDAPVDSDYDLAANFETGAMISDEHSVTVTMVQAGIVAMQGTITSAIAPSPIPRSLLTKAGVLTNVDGQDHMSITSVVSDHTCIGAGDGKVYSFAGNFVDDPDDYVFNRIYSPPLSPGSETIIATASDGGGLPDYISSPVDIQVTVTNFMPVLIVGVTYESIAVVSLDYFSVSAAGALVVTTVTKTHATYVTGPVVAGAILSNNFDFRVINPTLAINKISYLAGARVNINLITGSGLPVIPVLAPVVEATIRMPNQGPAFRAGMKVTFLQNYIGPFTIVHNQQWMARPNRDRQSDYKSQVVRPMPSFMKDAIYTSLYAAFGPAMGKCFGAREEYLSYLKMLEDPENLICLLMRDGY